MERTVEDLRAAVVEATVASAPAAEHERIRAWCAAEQERIDGLIADLLLTIRAMATLPG